MSAITTGNHPKALWPGVKDFFGAMYNEHPKEYVDLFEVVSSDKSYEEYVKTTSFGLVPKKPEGQGVTYDTHSQEWVKRITNIAYGMGYIVTKEELDDNLYLEKSFPRAKMLAFSLRQTEENVGANVYNRAFNSSYTGGDGKELLATDHPTASGDQSNELSTAADLSEASLEDLLIQIQQAKNDRGLKISLMGQCLIVPPALSFEAERIVKSSLQNDSANNAVNAIRSMGLLPKGIKVNHYLSDDDAWFVRTNCPDSLLWQDRVMAQFTQDNDFDTENAKAKVYRRFEASWADWRGLFGSPGA